MTHAVFADRKEVNMCANCEQEARNAADQNAATLSRALSGHGRAAHGRDAGRRRANAADREQENINAAWDQIYSQTLNRLLRSRH